MRAQIRCEIFLCMLIVPTRNRRAKYPEKLKGPLMPIIDPDSSPTRVAAQVVTGIGFLGAGVIWKEGICTRPEHRGDALVFGRCRSVGRLRLLAPRHPRSRCRRQSRAAASGRIDQPPADRVRQDRNLLCRQSHSWASTRRKSARFWCVTAARWRTVNTIV